MRKSIFPERIQRLNILILTIVIIYTIIVQNYLNTVTIVNPIIDSMGALLTSIGFYRLLLVVIFALINNSKLLLRIYWGELYLVGLWSYQYKLEGDTEGVVYYGVWCFEQDLVSTRVVGFGLDENFDIRSRVRSVTDLLENRGVYEIVNLRTDLLDPERDYYSKTSMTFDKNFRGLIKRNPIKIRAQTIIYGGQLSGNVHKDIFNKHEDAKCEDDVIEELRITI